MFEVEGDAYFQRKVLKGANVITGTLVNLYKATGAVVSPSDLCDLKFSSGNGTTYEEACRLARLVRPVTSIHKRYYKKLNAFRKAVLSMSTFKNNNLLP